MLVVGLTGGIGSGKTAVSDRFAQLGIPIIDTDILARELVAPGQPALKDIVAQFGSGCLDTTGHLDRTYLRRQVFAHPSLRKNLEVILHPRIKHELQCRLVSLNNPYCLVVIPLLVETGMQHLVHRILVVDVPEPVQIQRVMLRDQVDETQARRILSAQTSRDQRLALADDVIENHDDLSTLDSKITDLHSKYLNLALAYRNRPLPSAEG